MAKGTERQIEEVKRYFETVISGKRTVLNGAVGYQLSKQDVTYRSKQEYVFVGTQMIFSDGRLGEKARKWMEENDLKEIADRYDQTRLKKIRARKFEESKG